MKHTKSAPKYRTGRRAPKTVQLNINLPVKLDKKFADMTWEHKILPSVLAARIFEEFFERNGNGK